MASLISARVKHNDKKLWRARVRIDLVEYFLGTYLTKEEAEKAEQQFRDFYRNRK